MQARLFAMTGALALVAAGCGGGPYYYASCDPTVDPYYYADCGYGYGYGYYGDPWGYCDAYGCYDVVASASSAASSTLAAHPELSAVAGTLGSALHAASEVRRVAGSGAGGSDLVGPVDLDAKSAPGVPTATYRIVLSTATGSSSWQLQAKPTGAPDAAYRTVFSGSSSGAGGQAAQGQFGVDLGAWSAAAGMGGGGQVLASFADQGAQQATSYRLAGFRPDASASAFPDEVLTDFGPSKKASGPDGSASAALTAASTPPLAPAAPPTSMPGASQ